MEEREQELQEQEDQQDEQEQEKKEDESKLNIQVEVEDLGSCRKLLKIEVAKEDIENRIVEGFDKLSKDLTLPGFRKGKIPRRLIEKRFAEEVREQARNDLIKNSYEQAIKDKELEPISSLDFEFDSVKLEDESPLEFDVTIEVKPTFDLENYKGIELTKPSPEVSDEEVINHINSVRQQKAELVVVEEGSAGENDLVICDCEISVDGESAWRENDIEIKIWEGDQTIEGMSMPGLRGLMLGAKHNDKRMMDIKLDESCPMEEHIGKDAVLTVVVNDIKRLTLPEMNDALAKELGHKSLNDLIENARADMQTGREVNVQQNLETQLFAKLMESVEFDLPEGAVEERIGNYLEREKLRLQQQGLSPKEIGEAIGKEKETLVESAPQWFKLQFILDRIAEKEKILVTESEVDEMIALMARNNKLTSTRMRQQLERENSLGNLRQQMREDKTKAFLLENAVIN